jgi:hypothetical protein
MKLYAYLLFALISSIHVFAQDTSSVSSLKSSVFVELGSNFIQVNDNAGSNIDFSANWLINEKIYVGAAYTQIASLEERTLLLQIEPDLNVLTETNVAFSQQSVGARFGYILFHDHKIISFSPDLTVGWANFKFPSLDDNFAQNYETKHYAAITPTLKAVFNVSDYFRIGAAIHYRGYIGLNEDYIQGGDLSGVGGGIFFRIGKF